MIKVTNFINFYFLTIICALFTLNSCSQSSSNGPQESADTVYLNGRIYTVDKTHSWAEAVAIKGDSISFVGTDDGVKEFIGDNTKVIDLQGRMMMPAMQDSHIHPILGGIEALSCDLNAQVTLEDYKNVIANYAKENPDLDWLLGGGWSMAVFGAGGAPSKKILDELVPDRPVYLTSRDGHSGWANSLALEIAGITKDTPDPVDGIIDRDPETGELVGSLQEGAMSLLQKFVPPPSLEKRIAGLEYTINMLHSYGITSIQDASVDRPDFETYAALEKENKLTLHVVAAQWWERDKGTEQIEGFKSLRDEFTSDLVDASSIKIMQDGVLENYTAAMLEPYLEANGTKGIPMVDPEMLKKAVAKLDADGFQVHFHAIGDAAIRQSLDAIEYARNLNGPLGHRHHIAHLQVIHPDDIPRFAALDVVANFQPYWAAADEYIMDLNLPAIGEERTSWMYPIRSIEKTGATIAFGSDWSVSTANPFLEIETAVTRLGALGEPYPEFTPNERISLQSAIDAFTINAAFVNKQDDKTGSIEVGKLADLVVLNQNMFEINPDQISDTKVLITLFGGKSVYVNPDAN
ncbi:MAG: amidohydrolase [Kordiimonadaceae bacterium]|nr:amidohydrolase [Kordiimonadaceae bacterium]